jgi:hypothetical protein
MPEKRVISLLSAIGELGKFLRMMRIDFALTIQETMSKLVPKGY